LARDDGRTVRTTDKFTDIAIPLELIFPDIPEIAAASNQSIWVESTFPRAPCRYSIRGASLVVHRMAQRSQSDPVPTTSPQTSHAAGYAHRKVRGLFSRRVQYRRALHWRPSFRPGFSPEGLKATLRIRTSLWHTASISLIGDVPGGELPTVVDSTCPELLPAQCKLSVPLPTDMTGLDIHLHNVLLDWKYPTYFTM